MKTVFDSLEEYGRSGAYPFHMPGHKRNQELLKEMYGRRELSPYAIDITEIDGMDNLHHADGILLEAQKRAAAVYGAGESFYLINGSTCGLIAAVFACTKQRGAILMARNCHKAVYHAAELRELSTFYLYPETVDDGELNGRILPETIREMLLACPAVSAVLITSPTYDGMVSDIRAIAKIVHEYGKALIVDEAHGAHYGFSPYFPENAIRLGADIVVHSLHKTLPSFTQTALLSVRKESAFVDVEQVRKYLGMFETSSPSYVMMAGMDQCLGYVKENKGWLFAEFDEKLRDFYTFAKGLKNIRVVKKEYQDLSKILIFAEGMSGQELAEVLRKKYLLEVEMAAPGYVLCLTTIFDTKEGFERLKHALLELDTGCRPLQMNSQTHSQRNSLTDLHTGKRNVLTTVCRISEASSSDRISVSLKEAEGAVSGDYLYLYPPGIPLVVPGERISREIMEMAVLLQKEGFELQGMRDLHGESIQILVDSRTEKGRIIDIKE